MKNIFTSILILILSQNLFSQVIRDRKSITIGVALTQILRLNINENSGIGFEYDDYKIIININGKQGYGINNQTSFSVSSSVRWKINYGAETPYLIGMNNSTNKIEVNNIGFELINTGLHSFINGELRSDITNNATEITVLQQYPVVLIQDNKARYSNCGDDNDNSFILMWRFGSLENNMNQTSLSEQNIQPDTYQVNVIIELVPE